MAEVLADLGAYLETYNRNRPHRGRAMDGRTPCQVFKKRDPEAPEPEEVDHEGGEDRSLKRLTSAKPGVR